MNKAKELLKDVLDYADGVGKYDFRYLTDSRDREQRLLQAWLELKEDIEKFIDENSEPTIQVE